VKRQIQNYFDGATDTADGVVAGLSRIWFGKGDIELVTLDNPLSTAVIMEQREYGVAGAEWVAAGGVTRASIQRLNFFSSGFEYRARLVESSPARPLRLTIRTFDQAHRGPRHDLLVEAFSRGHVVGFEDSLARGVVDYGNVEGLKTTTAFMYFCFDPDPELQGWFGGAWEKAGVDYRKLHPNGQQFMLSTAVEQYNQNGGSGTGGGTGGGTGTGTDDGTGGTGGTGDGTDNTGGSTGNAGEIGGPPAVRTGNPSLAAPRSAQLAVYSPILGEALWADPVDRDVALDKYEVALNGTVVYIGTANAFTFTALSPSTPYTVSVVRFRDNGDYSLPTVGNNTTPATGTGGTPVDPVTADGNLTTIPFESIDVSQVAYTEQGSGTNPQAWVVGDTLTGFTGNGYIRTTDVNSQFGQGALAVYTNQLVDNTAPRRIWVRCRADSPGDTFAITSAGTGTAGLINVNSVDWVWIQSPDDWAQYDSSMQLLGISGGMSIDKVIVQSLQDTVIPTGEQGLRTS